MHELQLSSTYTTPDTTTRCSAGGAEYGGDIEVTTGAPISSLAMPSP